MAAAHPPPATELWASPTFWGMALELVLAPGTATGYKGVIKVTDNTFAARRKVGGKLQHVWAGDNPRECAFVLALLEIHPHREESIKQARKDFAKARALDRRIERMKHKRLTH